MSLIIEQVQSRQKIARNLQKAKEMRSVVLKTNSSAAWSGANTGIFVMRHFDSSSCRLKRPENTGVLKQYRSEVGEKGGEAGEAEMFAAWWLFTLAVLAELARSTIHVACAGGDVGLALAV